MSPDRKTCREIAVYAFASADNLYKKNVVILPGKTESL